ncbi:MAG: tetratricopeptide repeat protein [Deltaproteobacteria bacterium]|nr:tetratricopeptide repeat protein [Deltaproteobacteria bacterium]
MERSKVLMTAVLAAALAAGTACPPQSGPEPRPGAKPSGTRRAGAFSTEGMTAAMLEIESASGQARKALQASYGKDFRAEPKNPFKRFLWAYSLDDRNQAWQELSKVTKLNDRFYWAYLGMAIILDEWKVYDQAEQNFSRAIQLGQGIALGYARFGRMWLHKGEPAKAVAMLNQAIEKDFTNVDFRLDLARALAQTGEQQAARKEYAKVIEQAPDRFAPHAELADLLLALGDMEAAIASYGRAAALDRKDYRVRIVRAQLIEKLGKHDAAVPAYKEACEVKPRKVECWQELADLGAALNSVDLQVEAYERIVQADGENLKAHGFLAPIYLQRGEIERALPSYQVLLQDNPKNMDALAGLAEIYEKGEEFSKAIEFYQAVLEQKPDHAGAKSALAKLYARFFILPDPIEAKTPDKIFAINQTHIAKVYKLRLKEHPALQGDLLLKVGVDNSGQVVDVTMARNTVGDSVLDLCAIWNLRRSRFPAGFGATYDFELKLRPGEK